MNINDVVFWETLPKHYHRTEPFAVTVHYVDLSIREKSLIQDAIVNAAHEIRRLRGNENTDPFTNWRPGNDTNI